VLLRLFLLFTLVPVLELAFLVYLGSVIGPGWTILIVLTTGFSGAWLARREGFAVLRQLQESLQHGLPPATTLVEGALVLAGAILLITPGVFTDLTGLVLLAPPTRRWIAPAVLRALARRFRVDLQQVRGDAGEGGVWTGPAQEEEPAALPEEDRPDPHFDHPVR